MVLIVVLQVIFVVNATVTVTLMPIVLEISSVSREILISKYQVVVLMLHIQIGITVSNLNLLHLP